MLNCQQLVSSLIHANQLKRFPFPVSNRTSLTPQVLNFLQAQTSGNLNASQHRFHPRNREKTVTRHNSPSNWTFSSPTRSCCCWHKRIDRKLLHIFYFQHLFRSFPLLLSLFLLVGREETSFLLAPRPASTKILLNYFFRAARVALLEPSFWAHNRQRRHVFGNKVNYICNRKSGTRRETWKTLTATSENFFFSIFIAFSYLM